MKILGLVLELNPFHNGHAYFIKEAINKVQPDLTIAIISSNFSMRGDIMLINKWERSAKLLEHNIDLVIELPYLGSVASADYFCYNAVKSLSLLKITDLAFGVECDNLELLLKMKDLQNTKSFDNLIKTYLNKGHSYSNASLKALLELTNDEVIKANFGLPNNTLALGYLKAIDEVNPQIKVTLIKRIKNQYYDEDIVDELINSATSLRNSLRHNQEISSYTPFKTTYYDQISSEEKLFSYLQYLFSINESSYFQAFLGVDEGIENRFMALINKADNYQDFINLVQTKRYSANRIKRIILNIVLQIPQSLGNKYHYYLRLLAFNNNAKSYLNSLDKSIKKEIITSFKNNNNDLVKTELKASKLYSLLVNDHNLYLNEFKAPKENNL